MIFMGHIGLIHVFLVVILGRGICAFLYILSLLYYLSIFFLHIYLDFVFIETMAKACCVKFTQAVLRM
jgi:hypothetical protein